MLVIAAVGLAGCSATGMPYLEAQGSDLATVRTVSQEGSAAARKEPDTRILQVDGKRVPGYLPKGLTIAGGIRYIGVETSAGGASLRQCVMLLAKSGQRYVIRVAGPERGWAVSIVNEEMGGEDVAPVKVTRTQRSCPDSR
jgi:hypothetical protein